MRPGRLSPTTAAGTRLAICCGLAVAPVAAQTLGPGSLPSASPPAVPSAAAPSALGVAPSVAGPVGPCQEHLPEGKERPQATETFPDKALSGHAVWLVVSVTHGEGERVLPGGLKLQGDSDLHKAVERAGFVFPHPKSLAQPSVERVPGPGGVVTQVSIPVVPLPKEPGRHDLRLPSLPIAMTRASGEIITFCTEAHTVSVEDPIANTPNAEPQGNPEPRRQEELWVTARNVVYGGLLGLAVAALLALLYRLWSRRVRPVPPPPPPRPAWEVALEELHDIRYSQLVEQGRLEDHFDRVSNTLRKYLGGRYGFDGLESTTREILDRVPADAELPSGIRSAIDQFLEESDLIKFADVEPTEAQCRGGWDRAKEIVDRTRPAVVAPVPTAGEP